MCQVCLLTLSIYFLDSILRRLHNSGQCLFFQRHSLSYQRQREVVPTHVLDGRKHRDGISGVEGFVGREWSQDCRRLWRTVGVSLSYKQLCLDSEIYCHSIRGVSWMSADTNPRKLPLTRVITRT